MRDFQRSVKVIMEGFDEKSSFVCRRARSYVQLMLAKLLFVRFVPLEIFVERVTSVSCSV